VGWALANVWYDKYDGPPPQNSPLESLFMILVLRRMETDLLATRALVHASMTAESNVDPTVKAFKEYTDRALPFLAGAQDLEKQAEIEALLRFSKVKVGINKKMLYQKQAAQLKRGEASSRFKLKPKMPGL
jgi:hypothetical protein